MMLLYDTVVYLEKEEEQLGFVAVSFRDDERAAKEDAVEPAIYTKRKKGDDDGSRARKRGRMDGIAFLSL